MRDLKRGRQQCVKYVLWWRFDEIKGDLGVRRRFPVAKLESFPKILRTRPIVAQVPYKFVQEVL